MDGQVVEGDGGTGGQDWGELGLDPGVERLAVHRAGDDPRGDQALTCQSRDECLGLPATERCRTGQAVAFLGASAQAGQAGSHRGFVNEHQPIRDLAHEALMPLPIGPGRLQEGSATLGRDQAFFK